MLLLGDPFWQSHFEMEQTAVNSVVQAMDSAVIQYL